jgi:hypothetical protein
MKIVIATLLLPLQLLASRYEIAPGKFHKKGQADITVLPETTVYKVRMSYKLKSKDMVPVPKKFLQDEKIMEFPAEFKTEAGYQQLEKIQRINIPKATLTFTRRGDFANLKNAYFIEVRPHNKKSKINIVYHPSLPATGWQKITITMLSSFPLLDGYKLEANRVP